MAGPLTLRKPYTRLSDRLGGALALGAIGVFEDDPGSDYIEPKGQILRASDYPQIGQVLPLSVGFAPADDQTGTAYISNRGPLVAKEQYGLAVLGGAYNAIARSVDGGATWARKALGHSLSYPASCAMSDDGRYQLVADRDYQTSGANHALSADFGSTWTQGGIGNISYGPFKTRWLGSPHNLFVTCVQGSSGGAYAILVPSTGRSSFCNIGSSVHQFYDLDVNPITGLVCVAEWDAVNGGGVGIGVYPEGIKAETYTINGYARRLTGLNVYSVRHKNGVWLAGTGGGLYRSTDDGTTWTQVPGTANSTFYSVCFSAGKWIAQGPNGRNVAVLPPDASTFTMVDFLPNASGTSFYSSPVTEFWPTSGGVVAAVSTTPGLRPYLTAGTDPAAQFAVAPNVPSTGLVLPKRYYMRAR